MRWMPYGPDALLIEFAERESDEAFDRGRAIAAELDASPPRGLVEWVSGFTRVLLEFDPGVIPYPGLVADEVVAALTRALERRLPPAAVREIEVVYDGPDLERVAALNKLAVEDVCRLHSEEVYKVYMLGFAPGFPYLGDLNPRLHTPRLESPRTRVPAGAVAIGGRHTGIYSVESPGGWNIIGHARVCLFDPGAETLEGRFWLRPGDRVKFVMSGREGGGA